MTIPPNSKNALMLRRDFTMVVTHLVKNPQKNSPIRSRYVARSTPIYYDKYCVLCIYIYTKY